MTAAVMASPVQGDDEDVSERTGMCVSERPQAATREWAARTVA
jgi:hypothetical protein